MGQWHDIRPHLHTEKQVSNVMTRFQMGNYLIEMQQKLSHMQIVLGKV